MPVKALPPVDPGTYPGPGLASLLRENGQQWLFRQQLIAAGLTVGAAGINLSASIAVQLARIASYNVYPFGASMQIFFTDANGAASDPGAFEVDWQTSDIDADAHFCTISSLTGGLNGSFSGRIELPAFWAKYSRAYLKTLTNAVYVNVLLTR